jgi:hypothetical protein
MPRFKKYGPRLRVPKETAEFVISQAEAMAAQVAGAFQVPARRRGRKGGGTLRPGSETPLWNALRRRIRPHLLRYGQQANLGRLLGLPRQRINAFVTGGGEMPDAERTLQLLVWLAAVRQGRRPT